MDLKKHNKHDMKQDIQKGTQATDIISTALAWIEC